MQTILEQAKALAPEIISWRHQIHMQPEVGLDLPKTVALVTEELKKMGYEPQECGGGVVAVLDSGKPGKTLLLRADMDALPMDEDSGEAFSSQVAKSAHTCGHDTHTSMLLGAAKLLMDNKDNLAGGKVKFMFQPGEEGHGGGHKMVEAGVLENPHVDAAMGFHSFAGLDVPTGHVVYSPGPAMASCDMFTITVTGKGAHGARPEAGVDPLDILCHIHGMLQTINSRERKQLEPMVLTLGQLVCGDAPNIIPNEGYMRGSIRAFSEESRQLFIRRLNEISKGVAESLGGTAVVDCQSTGLATVNDLTVGSEMEGYLKELLGDDHVSTCEPSMGSEDFSEVISRVPGVFMRLSLGSCEEGYCFGGHHPKVRFNDEGLYLGSACFTHCALRWLEEHK